MTAAPNNTVPSSTVPSNADAALASRLTATASPLDSRRSPGAAGLPCSAQAAPPRP